MRKIFYMKDKKPILACGIIPVYEDNLVLQYEYKERAGTCYLSDFGGKIDMSDLSPLNCAIRELMEETNGYLFNNIHNKKLNKKILNYYLDNLKEIKKYIYLEKGKYLLFIIKINEEIFNKLKNLTIKFNEIKTKGLSHQIVIKKTIYDVNVKTHPRLLSI